MIRTSNVTRQLWAFVAHINYKYSVRMHGLWCESFVALPARGTLPLRCHWLISNHVASSSRSRRYLLDKPLNATSGLVCR
jgi:hypothetical protein